MVYHNRGWAIYSCSNSARDTGLTGDQCGLISRRIRLRGLVYRRWESSRCRHAEAERLQPGITK
jgi:hypothetical protein